MDAQTVIEQEQQRVAALHAAQAELAAARAITERAKVLTRLNAERDFWLGQQTILQDLSARVGQIDARVVITGHPLVREAVGGAVGRGLACCERRLARVNDELQQVK